LSGPLTPEEAEEIIEPFKARGVTSKIEDGVVYLTRAAHLAKIRTGENKIREIR
jgi:hypothetical protein